ncbi:MAG TPA: PQQ-binding-like beta-propeller repeat protein [Vicinamibacterales bacterium]|nr:PQQ-binding-like beta-propeller repeat protein [Vicinamibacterales bacterium]
MRTRLPLLLTATTLVALSYTPDLKVEPTFSIGALFAAGPSANWPGFRGESAAGVAADTRLPDVWDGTTGQNVAWKVAVPGLAHSSPIVWGHTVFVTSAVSSLGTATFKPGLYGAGTAAEDRSSHRWVVLAYDRATGKRLWERTAYEGLPREKRHIKSTCASSTPATDGRRVVAFFGSQGLYAYDMAGKLLWKKDLGVLNTGAYNDASYEWGTASSPTIFENMVFVQCDMQTDSFLMAVDIRTGDTVWKAPRKELSSWGTPTVYVPARCGRPELVTNSPYFIRGYDPATGRELWRLGGSSMITAPTPVFADDLIVVASGRAPERPIFAIRPGAVGDITLKEGQESSDAIAWRRTGRGSYMPTPIIHEGRLYVLGNAGLLDAYELKTGKEIYRQRIPHKGSGFSASPVLAGGRIYLSSEDGEVWVVKAGDRFEVLGTLPMGEPLMATPALAGGMMLIRGERHLFAIKRK